jgi:flagellar biogenesis protein FliO
MATKSLMLAVSLGLAALPLSAHAQRLGGASEPDISLPRILAALVLCVAAAVVLALIVAKRGRLHGLAAIGDWATSFRKPRRLKLMESVRISPHADLCLVTCDDTEFLLVCNQGEIRVLSENSVSLNAVGQQRS